MSQIKLGSALDDHRRAQQEAEDFINELVSPTWNVSESPHDDEEDQINAVANRLLSKVTGFEQLHVIPNSTSKTLRKGNDLRAVVFRRCIRILSLCMVREAFGNIRSAARFHGKKQSALKISINVFRNFWIKKVDRAFHIWSNNYTVRVSNHNNKVK